MNNLHEIFSTNRIIIDCNIPSKKRALELLSKLIAEEFEDVEYQDILTAFIEREKLGSTLLGHTIALPHARLESIKQPRAAILRLYEPIDYDDDENKAQLLVGLILPETDKELCLKTLGAIAGRLRNESVREKIFTTDSIEAIYQTLTAAPNEA